MNVILQQPVNGNLIDTNQGFIWKSLVAGREEGGTGCTYPHLVKYTSPLSVPSGT